MTQLPLIGRSITPIGRMIRHALPKTPKSRSNPAFDAVILEIGRAILDFRAAVLHPGNSNLDPRNADLSFALALLRIGTAIIENGRAILHAQPMI